MGVANSASEGPRLCDCLRRRNRHTELVFLHSARMNGGMPDFTDMLRLDDMELIRQYLVKRTQDLQAEFKVSIKS